MKALGVCLFGLWMGASLCAQEQKKWGDWTSWGQVSADRYENPVIPSDYSDLDCIRVGDDYYAISSTMQFSPGMTLLHSTDLVNWEICTNIIGDLTQIGPELNWNRMNRYGRGVWAGTLRYHDGRFYLFFGAPDEGYFMTSAERPEGPWDDLTPLLQERGWDDCTVMWDEDGTALGYLLLWKHRDGRFLLIDYLCVPAGRRNGGLGAALLRTLFDRCSPETVFIAESEAPTGEADEMILRRLAFYRRNGAETIGYDTALFGVHYKTIAWCRAGLPPEEEILQKHREIYLERFAGSRHENMIQVPLRPGEKPVERTDWVED